MPSKPVEPPPAIAKATTVWIYPDPSKRIGGVDHVKVFASKDAAELWFAEHDPEGVAVEYMVVD